MDTPGTAVEATPAESTPAATGSAPVETPGGAAGTVDPAGESAQPTGGNELPAGLRSEISKLRQFRRESRDRIAQLEDELRKQQQQSLSQRQPAKPDESFWTDPEGNIERRLNSRVSEVVSNAIRQAEVARSKQEALKFIRSQEGVTPEDEDDIAEIIQDKKLDVLIETNPLYAAEIALNEWKKSKGIQESTVRTAAKSRAQGSVSGAAPQPGKKVWTRSEIESIAKEPEQWAKYRDDIISAQKEGRIK